MLAVLLGLGVLATSPDLRAPPTPVAGGDDDQVDILQPEDGTYYPDAPMTIDVTVEVTNNSALEIQDVTLEVDGMAQEMTCEGAGNCEWSVTLEEGVHEFRAVVVRNIGGPLFSQFVEVQVGGDPPGADGGTAADDDDDDDAQSTGGSDGGTTDEAGDGTGDDEADAGETAESEGCACRTAPTGAGLGALWLLCLPAFRRRHL